MTAEPPIEILYLPAKLHELFDGRVPEIIFRNNPEQSENNFLSRSLAAYAIHKLSGCSLDEAAASVVDGGGDGGIDALHFSSATQILWVVQAKYIANGRGEPDLKDVNTFHTGLDFLLNGNFQAFSQNKGWQTLIPNLEDIFDRTVQVRPVLVYSGINLISEDRRIVFENLKSKLNSEEEEDDYVDFQVCNLTTIYDWLVGASSTPGIPEVELTILNPGCVEKPYKTIFGVVPIQELATLYNQYDKALVEANVRYYKGRTEVNEQILKSIQDEPEHFFYLNNGLTAYCERLKINNLDRLNSKKKRVTVYGFSIINGAQTLGSISDFFKKSSEAVANGNVFVKIISLEKCVENRKFAERITRSTNFQNQIGSRDFVALDEQQKRISNQLRLAGINYHYKDDVETPVSDETNFTLQEATTALSCLAKAPDCDDFCARILSNRSSLWSMDETYPEEPLKSRYSRVFRSERSARTVWRAVQIQRLVIKVMQDNGRSVSGVRKAFFENARWVLLHVIFIKLKLEQGNDLSLTANEVSIISQSTLNFAEKLWSICETKGYVTQQALGGGAVEFQTSRHFRSIFSSPSDCKILRGALIADLNQVQVPTPDASSDSESQ